MAQATGNLGMKRALALIGLCLWPAMPVQAATLQDQVIAVQAEDPEMNAAIEQARKSLPAFWARFDAPGSESSGFTLKVKLPTAHQSFEHIWVADLDRNGDTISGRIADEPQDIPGRKLGDTISFSSSQVSDWGYVSNGLLWGYFTTRVLVTRIPSEEAEPLLQILSPTPLEPEA